MLLGSGAIVESARIIIAKLEPQIDENMIIP